MLHSLLGGSRVESETSSLSGQGESKERPPPRGRRRAYEGEPPHEAVWGCHRLRVFLSGSRGPAWTQSRSVAGLRPCRSSWEPGGQAERTSQGRGRQGASLPGPALRPIGSHVLSTASLSTSRSEGRGERLELTEQALPVFLV